MNMDDWNLPPDEIERRSFSIIEAEAPQHNWLLPAWHVLRRMIHTTGDFEWISTVRMHPGAVAAGIKALRTGKPIFTDTNMAQAGINKTALAGWGCQTRCLIAAPEVAEAARDRGVTRALAAMDLAVAECPDAVFVIGNAPTALFRLLELAAAGKADPALVVGLPVGFVNAAEAKDALAASNLIHITALGRKGGSAVAACVINALARLAREEQS
jgi:precorrin-8X/cobalt-precorrin-8 methylmutase